MIKGLTKYGFVRKADEDFSDDGNRFLCYYYNGVRVSYLYDRNYGYYISPHFESDVLNYSELFELPHLRECQKLNNGRDVTDSDVEELKQLIDLTLSEIKEAENNAELVSDQIISDRLNSEQKYKEDILNDLNERIDTLNSINIIMTLSDYDLRNLKYYYKLVVDNVNRKIDINNYPQILRRSKMSSTNEKECASLLYYKNRCLEILAPVKSSLK